MKRLTHLDWLRGLAVLIMILWHTMDSWTAASARHNATFDFITLTGGWAAPLFLFLAGVSLALAGQAGLPRDRGHSAPAAAVPSESASRGAAARGGGAPSATNLADTSWRLQKRGWQIFLLAHLFRFQAFLLNPGASWESLLKPDILNILGLGMAATAWCWGRATTRTRRVFWLLGPAVAIVLLAPGSRVWEWPAAFRAFAPRLEAYIRPVSGMGVFSVFPWLAFVFVGALLGTHIASHRHESVQLRLQLELTVVGVLIGAAGLVGRHLPALSSHSSFWTTSISFFLIRTGAMTMMIPAAWLWMRRGGSRAARAVRSPMVLFGQTSLFVYWVHVELAYGIFSYPLHGALSLRAALVAYVIFTACMLGLAVVWRRRTPLKFKVLSSDRHAAGPSGFPDRQTDRVSSPNLELRT